MDTNEEQPKKRRLKDNLHEKNFETFGGLNTKKLRYRVNPHSKAARSIKEAPE